LKWRKRMRSNTNPDADVARTLEVDEPYGYGKWVKRFIIVAILVIAVLAGVVVWRTSRKSDLPQYKTEEVKRADLTVIVTATGNLKPTNSVDVGSELSGTVKSVEVDYNSGVKVGQILAKLDTTKLEATLTQSRAALESAKAKILQARATVAETRAKLAQYQRVRELSNGKVPSQSEMDAAEAAFERAGADEASARAAVSQAEATVKTTETDLSKSVIRSPISGIVLTRSIEPGQTVAASFQSPVLFTLAEDLTQMELHVNVDEADIGKVREGQEATFSVAAYPDRTFQARITQARFGSSTTSGVVTYETVLKVNNSDLSLRPGMTATADITVKKVENALLIPSAALHFTPPVQEERKEEKKPSGSLVGSLLPRPPSPASKQGPVVSSNKKQQRVWILKEGQLAAIPVTVGSTDGSMSEIDAGGIERGMAVVVDTVSAVK
jgi:HlyD family secretion protein